MKRLRYAAFGTGYWSTLQIPAWNEVGGVELVALYNRTVAKAEKMAEKYGNPRVYSDPEELFRNEQIDFADIITEVPAHETLVLLAAKYKVPVICQKPMSFDLESCTRMITACEEAKVPLFIHENYRWQPPFRAIKKFLNKGLIGQPYRAHIQLSYGGAEMFQVQPYLATLKYVHHMDMGPHIFDLARFYFGEAQTIYVQTSKSVPFIKGDDMFSSLLKIGPTICSCEIGNNLENRIFIEGDKGWLLLDKENILHIHDGNHTSKIDTKTWHQYNWVSDCDYNLHGGDCIQSIVSCNKHLLESLQNGKAAETTGRDNLQTMKLVFASIESTQTGKVITL
jgi:predicted dehydrogenase